MNIDQPWKKQSYYEIYRIHQGFACHKWVHYPFVYDQIFARHLDAGKPLCLLEIGTQNGGSLEVWKKYLPPGSEIHGMDINPKCLELNFSANIHFHLGSAADNAFVNCLFADKGFDIIIDDGSHLCGEVISTFLNLFKKINPGGIYIIEDMHTSYWENFGGGLRNKNSSIEFFKQFIDTIHADYIRGKQFPEGGNSTRFLKMCRQEIAGISFFDSICAITRFAQAKLTPFNTIVNGNIFKVEPSDAFKNITLKDRWQDIEAARIMYATCRSDTQSATAEKTGISLAHGIEAFQQDDFESAIEDLSTAMVEEPNNPLPRAYLAFIYARQGLLLEARDFIAQAIKIAPERADLIAALGEVLLKNNRPSEAVEYLREAIHKEPDMFAAYPALAQSLHLTRQSAEAVSLLQSAASLPSNAQASIQNVLLQILAECGDLSEFAKYTRHFSTGLPDDLLAARCLARCDASGETFLDTLANIQTRLAGLIQSDQAVPARKNDNLTRIAFIVGDFTSCQQLEQLYALCRYLPAEHFFTLLISCYTQTPRNDSIQMCALLADTILYIHQDDDNSAIEKLNAHAPDILIDMQAFAPSEHLAAFLSAPVPHKFLWGEAPMPPIAPAVRTLAGAFLAVENMLPSVSLPDMGEVYDLPELPFADEAACKMGEAPVLGCLLPAQGIGRNGWQLFAATLRQYPDATLVINLEELGEAAKTFINRQFSGAGVDPARLVFINVRTTEEFCLAWQSIDLGLLPPTNPGGIALPTCLWMGRPCLVLASILPWAQRPAALLKALGREEWIATDTPHYTELAHQLAAPNQQIIPDPALRERMQALGLTDAKGFALGFARVMTDLSRNDQSTPQPAFPNG
ncbi:MAG: tetratricopeptide repeat protein [Betaproteobacteria bacterium]|nr:tetratricopeptide repeat protein [Betaproteobacteria bacterium]